MVLVYLNLFYGSNWPFPQAVEGWSIIGFLHINYMYAMNISDIWIDYFTRLDRERHWIRIVKLFYCAVSVPHMRWMTCHIIYATQYNSVVLSFLASNRQIYLSYGFLQFKWRKIMLYFSCRTWLYANQTFWRIKILWFDPFLKTLTIDLN